MNKFLITASVVSAFLIASVAPASAVDIENEDNSEYTITLFKTGALGNDVKTFKLAPGQTMKGVCDDMCTLRIESANESFDSYESVVANSKVKIKQGRIIRN